MKIFINSTVNYLVNLIIAVALSFSFVYAFTTTWKMTYGAKDVLICVGIISVVCTIAFGSRLAVKISAGASVFVVLGGLYYFLKKPSLYDLVYSKVVSANLWLQGYINGELPLNQEYQEYIFLGISIAISFIVYIFAVKEFNFHVLLIGGVSLFAAQWIIDYFLIYFSFYIFVFFILICYLKHIYLKNTKGQSPSRQASGAFLLLSVPISALVFLFAFFMPASDKPIEWDWMDSKIESTQSYIERKLNNSNTEYYTIYSTGFGENSLRLGGNVTLDTTVVMKVDSPESGIYLKGAVKEQYTGYSWQNAESSLISLGEKSQFDDFDTDIKNVANKSFAKTKLKITYENLITKTLFIPVKTKSIKFDAGPLNVLLDSYGMPSSNDILGKQFRYTVELYSLKNNNQSFIKLLRNSDRGSGLSNSARYLQLPDELPERVRKLALEITSSAKTDYDRVKALESYLSKNYRYTLEPGTTPRDRDFVDYFLFDLREGYCTYYASAMTVLTRSLGIPARYVEGYVLPSQPVQGTTYAVTNKEAHAWVEVYFEGFGWIPFEPTASISQNLNGTTAQTASNENNTPDRPNIEQSQSTETNKPAQPNTEQSKPTDEVTPSPNTSEQSSNSTGRGTGNGSKAWLLIKYTVPIILALLWVTVFSPLRRKYRLERLVRLTPQKGVIEIYRHLLKVLSVQGYKIKPGETPLMFAQRIEDSLQLKPSSFKTVTDVFTKARYSNIPIYEEEMHLILDFYNAFPAKCKERIGFLRYFVYHNLLGII